MNLLGYQAMAVGNHEFDNGPAHLADFLDHVEIPVLSANTTRAPSRCWTAGWFSVR